MWSPSALTLFLAILHISVCAPVTKYQTVTAITNADGSPYTWSPNAVANEVAATSTVAVQAAANTPASGSTSSSSGFMGFLNSLASILSDSDSSSSAGSSGSSGSSSDTTTSESSGSSWGSLFSSFLKKLGGSDTSSSTSGSSTNVGTANNVAASTPSGASTSTKASTSWSKSTDSSDSSASSNSDSSASSGSDSDSDSTTGGIYDAIYNSDESIDKDFAKAILDSHNSYRALHGASALSWASGPYSYAKNNADNYDCSGVLTHTHGQYGENLAAGFSTGPSAVKAWYVEGETYDYSTHNEYNHFTQVVWKGSTHVGCAYKDCSAEGWGKYVVCEYSPAGNIIGREEANVLPLTS